MQSEEDGCGGQRFAREVATLESDVGANGIDPGPVTRVLRGVVVCRGISEFASRFDASLVRTQAFGNERFGGSIDLELYLFVDLAVDFRAPEDGSEPESDSVQQWWPARDERLRLG